MSKPAKKATARTKVAAKVKAKPAPVVKAKKARTRSAHDPETGLLDQQRRFADEYLLDFDATAAYIRAGYKGRDNAARASASRMIALPQVQAYLRQRRNALSQELQIEQADIIRELAKVGFFNVGSCRNEDGSFKAVEDWPAEATAAIAGIEFEEIFAGKGEKRHAIGRTTKVKLVNKVEPLVKIGVHLGMFAKNVKVNGVVKHEHEAIAGILDDIDAEGAGTGLPSHASTKH